MTIPPLARLATIVLLFGCAPPPPATQPPPRTALEPSAVLLRLARMSEARELLRDPGEDPEQLEEALAEAPRERRGGVLVRLARARLASIEQAMRRRNRLASRVEEAERALARARTRAAEDLGDEADDDWEDSADEETDDDWDDEPREDVGDGSDEREDTRDESDEDSDDDAWEDEGDDWDDDDDDGWEGDDDDDGWDDDDDDGWDERVAWRGKSKNARDRRRAIARRRARQRHAWRRDRTVAASRRRARRQSRSERARPARSRRQRPEPAPEPEPEPQVTRELPEGIDVLPEERRVLEAQAALEAATRDVRTEHRALARLERQLDDAPEHARTALRFAIVWSAWRAGDQSAAERAERFTEQNDRAGDLLALAWMLRGELALSANRPGEARRAFRFGMNRLGEPLYAFTLWRTATAHLEEGDDVAARESLVALERAGCDVDAHELTRQLAYHAAANLRHDVVEDADGVLRPETCPARSESSEDEAWAPEE